MFKDLVLNLAVLVLLLCLAFAIIVAAGHSLFILNQFITGGL